MAFESIHETHITLGRRSYFFDIKPTKKGKLYLKITESKRVDEKDFERRQIIVHEEGMEDFFLELHKVAHVMQKLKFSESEIVRDGDVITNPISLDGRKSKETIQNRGKPWTDKDDEDLELLYCKGEKVKDLAEMFGRTIGAIQSRIKKLELEENYR